MIKIAGILMDLALSEEIVFPGDATKLPTETGSEFTDHIRDLPHEITLECIVSDSPIGDVATDPSRQRGVNDFGDQLPMPSIDALARLREMKALRKPVTIETSLGVFDQMACTEITVPVSKEKSPGSVKRGADGKTQERAGALFFTAKFQRINIITNRRTKVRVKTPMAGAGTGKAKSKIVTGFAAAVDNTVVWNHASPPGSFNFTKISKVEVIHSIPQGFSRDEAERLDRTTPGSPLIKYFDLGQPVEITGARRADLIADLSRDKALEEQRRLHERSSLARRFERDRNRNANLPGGLSVERFQQQPFSDFTPAPDAADSDLSRFQRHASRFPGT